MARTPNSFPYKTLNSAIEGTEAPQHVIDSLELVPIDFIDFDFSSKVGQLVVAKAVAGDVQEIFGKIRDAKFPIESIIPVRKYAWDDHTSIHANNTSGFNYRLIKGTEKLSSHSHGTAIDINPALNPYLFPDGTTRPAGYTYNTRVPGTIREGDAVTRAFDHHGWEWGGRWQRENGVIDPQHFNMPT